MKEQTPCCPPFNPELWDEKTIDWNDKRFVKDRVRSLFHIPLNFGAVMKRIVGKIESAEAKCEEMIVLSDEESPWRANVFVDVDRDVSNAEMVTLSGTFLSKVFEGPYRDMRKWMVEMEHYISSQGKRAKRQFYYYTTCPKCAKVYGKNYVVILTEV